MAKITTEDLKKINACGYAIKVFQDCFGEEIDVTLENSERFEASYGNGWLYYAARSLLTEASYRILTNKDNGHSGPTELACPGCRSIRATFVELYNKEHS